MGGQKYLCEKGTVPPKKASKKQHYILLGVTLLTGDPLIGVMVLSGGGCWNIRPPITSHNKHEGYGTQK